MALEPLRRDLLPLYTRWINDLDAARTLGAFLPVTLEGETKWYDESATSEKTVPFTVYARPDLRPIDTASLFEVDHRNRTAVFGIFIGDRELQGQRLRHGDYPPSARTDGRRRRPSTRPSCAPRDSLLVFGTGLTG